MTKELLLIIKAYAEGKEIQLKYLDGSHCGGEKE